MLKIDSTYFTTKDSVRLHYLEVGEGPVLVLLPGWSQSAAQFRGQLEGLSDSFRCIALDHRGHGDSDRPDHGYRLSRLAMDLRELLAVLNLTDVVLLGHSAGCAVIWNYLDLFGEEGIRAIVLCDQMIARIRRPEWTEAECRNYGASIGGDEALEQAAAVGGPNGEAITRQFLATMFTPNFSSEERNRVIEDNLKFPRPYAAQLMLSVTYADFRDLLPRITRPALCIGGKCSHLGPYVMPWIASQIPHAQITMIEVAEGGSHFAFMENSSTFNAAVRAFCSGL